MTGERNPLTGELGSTAGRARIYQQWIKEKGQDPRLCREGHLKRSAELR